MEQINVYDALKLMRKLSAENFPFSFSFISCDRSKRSSEGLVVVEEAILTKGMPNSKSKYAKNLIAYQNLKTGEYRQFWVPLLMTVNNNLQISHDRVFRR
ncbi:hypothetical protein [Chryseobacterium vrystaatense]|uniref:Uncharacterized protein n=1 Tax=Chryseobacterium vrystaatense TaxID=307480 RepID=A0ABR4UJ40_9FLAO|nr:hypothetical protein [Chryseobacterium vrystaatense]KFF24757.1 hypothetical protein IW16_17635 [Chryseobacterium vrystaatense]